MQAYLPLNDFHFISQDEIRNLFDTLESIPDDSEYGYLMEVTMDYDESLHDAHADFPFLPENIKTDHSKVEKLCATVMKKQKYVAHYTIIQQAMKNGLELQRIHRVLKFRQAPFLKPYIDLNTKLRQTAKTKSLKQVAKLLSNSLYGKMIENVHKFKVVKLVSTWKSKQNRIGMEDYVASGMVKNIKIIGEGKDFVIKELRKKRLFYNRPIQIGQAVLDISKRCVYNMHYDIIKKKFPTAKLLYTDTDSLFYHIEHENIYHEIAKDIPIIPNSKYGIQQITQMKI